MAFEDTSAQDTLGLDALMVYTALLTGGFADESQLSMETVTEVSCEGTDCATVELLLGAFPCHLSLSRDAQASP